MIGFLLKVQYSWAKHLYISLRRINLIEEEIVNVG